MVHQTMTVWLCVCVYLGGSGTGTGTGAGAGVGLGEGTETGATVGTERLGRAISISSPKNKTIMIKKKHPHRL